MGGQGWRDVHLAVEPPDEVFSPGPVDLPFSTAGALAAVHLSRPGRSVERQDFQSRQRGKLESDPGEGEGRGQENRPRQVLVSLAAQLVLITIEMHRASG